MPQIDPCRAATGQDKGKVERQVRTDRGAFADLFLARWDTLEALRAALDARAVELHARRRCPLTGTSVADALEQERAVLQPVPAVHVGGADPQGADLDDLFNTYRLDLFERFLALGVDMTAGHALASALAYHTSTRPLFGFAKRYRESGPKVQTELNALAHHVGKGNEKGVQLSLWAGADPHAPAPSRRFPTVSEEDASADDGDRFHGYSAVYAACLCGRAAILKRLGPDPARDDFEELYRAARGTEVIEILIRLARPRDVGALFDSHLRHMRLGLSDWGSKYALSHLFELGDRGGEEITIAI